MAEKKQRRYFRLDRAERASIERALDKKQSARSMARDLGRSPASITDEVKRNRTVAKDPGGGERAGDVPEDACERLQAWPWTCNGCRLRRYHCSKRFKCEYSAARAQALADGLLSEARKSVNEKEHDFERAMALIGSDVARGLSPAQIADGRASEFRAHPSTIYRWVAAGYAGMSNAELRRKVGYKPRKEPAQAKPTSHGPERSYKAFSALPEEERARACEMDTGSACPRTRSASSRSTCAPARCRSACFCPRRRRAPLPRRLACWKERSESPSSSACSDSSSRTTAPSSRTRRPWSARPSMGRPAAKCTTATSASPSRRADASAYVFKHIVSLMFPD